MDKIFPRRDVLAENLSRVFISTVIVSHRFAITFTKLRSGVLKLSVWGFFLNSFFSLCYSYWKDLPISRLNIFTASSYSFTLLLLPFGIATPFPSFLAFAFQDVFLGRKHYCHSSLALLKQTSQILSVHSRKTDHPDL